MKRAIIGILMFTGLALATSQFVVAQDAIHVTSVGDVGFGTNTPTAAVEVLRSDGSAKILVSETGAAAPRTLFQLSNPGNTKFGILNTEAGVEWAFANPGTGFRLSRQGSGVVEMEILNNGNMVISGTLTELSDINSKTAITEVNPEEILSLISNLPVSQWEYKDARGELHIGPMAQDFYAAFGLGASEIGISSVDTAGVALVAIKALSNENKQLRKHLKDQNDRLAVLENRQIQMQSMMTSILNTQNADMS